MRLLKPGESCPLCGMSIREGLPKRELLLLSYVAEGMSLLDAINALTEVMELPPLGGVVVQGDALAEPLEPGPPEQVKTESEDIGAEKRAVVQRLKAYRDAYGLGCLDKVAEKTAHRKGARISEDTLRDIAGGCAPKMELSEWQKIAKALAALEAKEAANG